MADAVHDLGDSISIGLAWYLSRLGDKKADEQFTYGYRRFSLLGAVINGLVMVVGSIWVLSEAIPRLSDPVMPAAEGMLILALLGVTVNGYAAYKLSHGKTVNEKMLNWHLLEDVLGWVAVLVVAIVLLFVDWPILDPILSIAFTAFILVNVFRSLRVTVRLFLQGAPTDTIRQRLHDTLLSVDHVQGLHHFHIWSLDGEHHVLTVHLVLDKTPTIVQLLSIKDEVAATLKPFTLEHTTIELEFPDEECRDVAHLDIPPPE